MHIERKFVSLSDFKTIDDGNGGIAGYASRFNEIDSVDDIVLAGAYTDTLADFIHAGWLAPDHSWGVADDLGIITSAQEDDIGLFFTAEFHPTADAQQVRQKILNRLAKGKSVRLSIGYQIIEAEMVTGKAAIAHLRGGYTPEQIKSIEAKPQIRLLKRIKLYEVSLVSVPALASAAVTGAKALQDDTQDETMPLAGMTFSQHSEQALAAAREFVNRAKALHDLRAKEGRVLSTANRNRLSTMRSALDALRTEIDELLTATQPTEETEKRASVDDVARLLAEIELSRFQQIQN